MRVTRGNSLTSQVAAIIACLFSIWLPNEKHLTDTKKDLTCPSFPVIKIASHYSAAPAHISQMLLAETFTMTTAPQLLPTAAGANNYSMSTVKFCASASPKTVSNQSTQQMRFHSREVLASYTGSLVLRPRQDGRPEGEKR